MTFLWLLCFRIGGSLLFLACILKNVFLSVCLLSWLLLYFYQYGPLVLLRFCFNKNYQKKRRKASWSLESMLGEHCLSGFSPYIQITFSAELPNHIVNWSSKSGKENILQNLINNFFATHMYCETNDHLNGNKWSFILSKCVQIGFKSGVQRTSSLAHNISPSLIPLDLTPDHSYLVPANYCWTRN